jgi:hypothetical protein
MIKKIINAFLCLVASKRFRKMMAIRDGIKPYNNNSGNPSLFVPISKILNGAASYINHPDHIADHAKCGIYFRFI